LRKDKAILLALTTCFIVVTVVSTSGMVPLAGITPKIAIGAATSPHYLGFWLQEGNIMSYMGATNFAQQYFGTAPYPSGLEMMTFGPVNDFNAGTTGSATSTIASAQYWSQVASYADSHYPGAHIQMMVGICHNSAKYTCQTSDYQTGLNLFQTWLNTFGHHASVYSVGVEAEYTDNMWKTNSALASIMNMVHSAGYQFVSYGAYLSSANMPSGGYIIGHTNFPGGDNGCLTGGNCDAEYTLTNFFVSSPYVGISSGYYAQFSYPASQPTCPLASTSSYTGSGYGWNQCIVDTEISAALSVSPQYREFVNLCPGFANTQSNSNQLWMDSTLRNWIWTDPLYQSNFVLSTTGSVSPSTSISSSTSSTSHSSISSTSTATSSSPKVTSTTLTKTTTITLTSTKTISSTTATTVTSTLTSTSPVTTTRTVTSTTPITTTKSITTSVTNVQNTTQTVTAPVTTTTTQTVTSLPTTTTIISTQTVSNGQTTTVTSATNSTVTATVTAVSTVVTTNVIIATVTATQGTSSQFLALSGTSSTSTSSTSHAHGHQGGNSTKTSSKNAVATSPSLTLASNTTASNSGAQAVAAPASGVTFSEVFGFVPGVSSNPTPAGNAIFAYEFALVVGLPFALRKAAKHASSEEESHEWRW